ncbi:glycoside hydrolase family 43 protein [Cohnella xylanilytica]|uniref:Glycoside hydrolase family 43 protein n=1 Tax=Cohnella xylanilytica TaxID=557555 RepID=A0A841U4R1_9BACL|nr:glycoside hydrolase family 43 protein [Cohnella xylanilytica]MBB6694098.1 glycoside hydrolase family 43 protein [Cohnella xylanilytica]
MYSNPVIRGFHPDPSVCRVGDDYYLATSSFEYFPGIPIFHSRNLVHWRQLGHVLTRESQLPLARKNDYPSSLGIYAPTLRHHNGRFYVVTTNVTSGENFYVWAERPEGPWSEPVVIEGWGGIDPDLFFDDDGTVYLTGTSQYRTEPEGIYQAELDIATGKLRSERRLVWTGTGGSSPEGPHLYKIGGWYYLMIAEGGTEYGHMETIARSRAPQGPFEPNPHNPILSNRSTDKPIQATGHADLVQAPDGRWWAVLLGIRPVGYPRRHHLGRETMLAPVAWTEEGWPVVGTEGRIEVDNDDGTLPPGQPEPRLERDSFDGPSLAPEWNFYRNPAPGSWSLSERSGWLTLYGQACSLNDYGSPAFVGRRQQHFDCEVETRMRFVPEAEGEEAGLTVFMNEGFHYEIAKTRREGKPLLLFRRRIGSLAKTEAEIGFEEPEVVLGVEAKDVGYSFYYRGSDGEKRTIGSGESAMLATETAGGFTGVYFALYATGNGRACAAPARFDYFQYVPSERI